MKLLATLFANVHCCCYVVVLYVILFHQVFGTFEFLQAFKNSYIKLRKNSHFLLDKGQISAQEHH